MRMRFDAMDDGEEEAFAATRDALVDEVALWATERFGESGEARAADAQTFLQWKFNYGDGWLDDITRADLAEYLLEWCPRKVSAPPATVFDLADGAGALIEMLGTSGRLVGGVDRVAQLLSYLDDLRPAAYEAMGDTSKFGMAKSLFSTPLTGADDAPLPSLFDLGDLGELDPEQLQAILDERMAAFNALPFEQRKAITDPAMFPAPQRVTLDFVHVAPAADEVEAAARTSRLLAMVDGFAEWYGPKGRPLTQTGAIKLADARVLVDHLATGDRFGGDPEGFRSEVRSSRELPILSLVNMLAEAAGATTARKTKLYGSPAWAELPVATRARTMLEWFLRIGALGWRENRTELFAEIGSLLDAGIVHWLTGALPPGPELPIDDVVEMAVTVCDQHLPRFRRRWGDEAWERLIEHEVHELFTVLELAGLVELHGRRQTANRFGEADSAGGTFTGTALLRAVLPPFSHEAGYDFAELGDLTDADAEDVLWAYADDLISAEDIAARWRAGSPARERIGALVELAAAADDPGQRVAVFALLEELSTSFADPQTAAPLVRELLDTPSSAHAALYLVEHDQATPEELAGFFSVGALVDHLSMLIDDRDALAGMFADAQAYMVDDLIEAMWRHDQPETLPVLEALGRALPDKHLAKAARKAAMKHRSWLANRHP